MPTYQIYANQGILSPQQKSAAAVAVTDAHCQQTGAPRYYVQVIFHDIPEENRFVAGNPFGEHIWIRGDVRIRTPEENKALMLALAEGMSHASGIDKNFIWCDLCPVEPTNILKFGTVFPPAGQEQSWYDGLSPEVKRAIARITDTENT